jgi:hypothetical protein
MLYATDTHDMHINSWKEISTVNALNFHSSLNLSQLTNYSALDNFCNFLQSLQIDFGIATSNK